MYEYCLIEDDIINKQYYEQIKDIVTCLICLNIIVNPVQCVNCQHNYCSECIEKISKCPMGCQNNNFIPGVYCKQLLSGIKIKCECGLEIEYNNIKKHKEEECETIDFKERYIQLKKNYDEIREELDNSNEFIEIKNNGGIKSYVHKHPIYVMRHFKNSWYCDICDICFSADIPSYNCSVCDFDVCYNCVKDKITKGVIDNDLKNFYEMLY